MKNILYIVFVLIQVSAFTQVASPLCNGAQNICGQNGTSFPLSIGGASGIPAGNNISNPSTNPQGVNTGCLLSNGPNPNWFVINIGASGNLEFNIGQAGGSGFYDWALWPYNPTTTCNGIQNNTLPPVSCNWNGSAGGFTGMSNGGPPPGGQATNFQPSIPVLAGQAYVLCFSNYSSQTGNASLTFPTNPTSAGITCSPGTPDQTICQTNNTTVNIVSPIPVATANWLVTTGIVNPSNGITGVVLSPPVTTQYVVQLTLTSGTVVNDTFSINVIPQQTPNAGIDQTVCFGTPIQLSASAPTPPNTVAWQSLLPTGLTPPATASFLPNFSSPTATVTVNHPGVYKFIWRETSTMCGVRRDTVQITVSELQITAASTSPSCFAGNDGVVTITSPNATEYSFNNGVSWVPTNTLNTFNAGTYTVCAKNLLGCQKCTTVTVVNPAQVVMTAGADQTVCQNGTALMSVTATGGTSYTANWESGGVALTESVSPISTGFYTVSVTNQAGCTSNMDSILVTVRPPITAVLSPLNQKVCPFYPGTLTVNSVSGGVAPYNFSWSTGEIDNATNTSSITKSPGITTNYIVTITDACESSPLILSTQIETHPLPIPLISVDEPIKCEPAIFTLTNITDPAMSSSTKWSINNGQEEFVNMNEVSPAALYAGSYNVQLIVTSSEGCIDSTTFQDFLLVKPKPVADFKWSPDPVTMFNTTVDFTNYSTGADTYIWSFDGGSPGFSTNIDQTVSYPDGVVTTYQVWLIANSNLGCADTVNKQVQVFPEVLIYAPNSFTPDGDEFNQTWGVVIDGIDKFDFTLLIYNRWGETIWESYDVNAKWDGTYKGDVVKAGTYIWTIRTKDFLNDKKYEFNGSINIIR